MSVDRLNGYSSDDTMRMQRKIDAIPQSKLLEIATLNPTGDPENAPEVIWMSYEDTSADIVDPEHAMDIESKTQLVLNPIRAICERLGSCAARISFPRIGNIYTSPRDLEQYEELDK